MHDRKIACFFLALIFVFPVFPDGQTVLQQLGAKTDENGDVHLRYGMRPLDEILSSKTIQKEILEKQEYQDSGRQQGSTRPQFSSSRENPEENEIIQLANHNCRPDLLPSVPLPGDSSAFKPPYLKEGLSSKETFLLLGPPLQKTFCLACPLWKYREGFVAFTAGHSVAFWDGKEFEKYLPRRSKKTGPVVVSMSKDEVLSILGAPDGGLSLHNDWRYGKSHVIFSKNTGLVTHLLRFDTSIP